VALAELREADAPPDIAALFAAIRRASGVPLVNLIHRHFATLPGVLPWVWEAIQPALEDGRLAAARTRLEAALPMPEIPPLPSADWARSGLPTAVRNEVVALAAVYTRGNLTNLILLTALRLELEGVPPEPSEPADPLVQGLPESSSAMLPSPPPLPVMDALPAATRAAVLALAARHGESGVVPSLYLHCAHWPTLPALLPDWLGGVLSPPAIAAGRNAAVWHAERAADGLRPTLRNDVPAGQRAAVLAVLEQFTGQVIPAMVPVSIALGRRLGDR